MCHGEDGAGLGGVFPDVRHLPAGYFAWITRNGRSGTAMSAFTPQSISDNDIQAANAYLNAIPLPESGEELYTDLCSSCHGAAGVGKTGRGPSITAKALTEVVRSGKGGDNYAGEEYMPAFSTQMLPDAALLAIETYLK